MPPKKRSKCRRHHKNFKGCELCTQRFICWTEGEQEPISYNSIPSDQLKVMLKNMEEISKSMEKTGITIKQFSDTCEKFGKINNV